jgi:hypothetical protein
VGIRETKGAAGKRKMRGDRRERGSREEIIRKRRVETVVAHYEVLVFRMCIKVLPG